MKRGEQPLGTFALIVIGLEMLAVAGVIWYACTVAANEGRSATWFGERHPVTGSPLMGYPRGPKASNP
jgi:hypothetical protein